MTIEFTQYFPWINPGLLGLYTASMILYPARASHLWICVFVLPIWILLQGILYGISLLIAMVLSYIGKVFCKKPGETMASPNHASVCPVDGNSFIKNIFFSIPWLTLISFIPGLCIHLESYDENIFFFTVINSMFDDSRARPAIVIYIIACAAVVRLICQRILSSKFLCRLFSIQNEAISPLWKGHCYLFIAVVVNSFAFFFVPSPFSGPDSKGLLASIGSSLALGVAISFLQLGLIGAINFLGSFDLPPAIARLVTCLDCSFDQSPSCNSSITVDKLTKESPIYDNNNAILSNEGQSTPHYRHLSGSRIKLAREVAYQIISLKTISPHRSKLRSPLSSRSNKVKRVKKASIINDDQLDEDTMSLSLLTPTSLEPLLDLILSSDTIVKEKDINEEVKEESILEPNPTISPLITPISSPSAHSSTPNHEITLTEDFYNELAANAVPPVLSLDDALSPVPSLDDALPPIPSLNDALPPVPSLDDALPPVPSIENKIDNNNITSLYKSLLSILPFNQTVHTSFPNGDGANVEVQRELPDQNLADELNKEKNAVLIGTSNICSKNSLTHFNQYSNRTIINGSDDKNATFHDDQPDTSTSPQSPDDIVSTSDLMASQLYVKVGVPSTYSVTADFEIMTCYTGAFSGQ